MGWIGMEWNMIGWDGMGQNRMGQNRMGQNRMEQNVMRQIKTHKKIGCEVLKWDEIMRDFILSPV